MASKLNHIAPDYIVREDDGEQVAQATRYYKSDGADFTGWIVSSVHDRRSYSDVIPTKPEAIALLKTWEV